MTSGQVVALVIGITAIDALLIGTGWILLRHKGLRSSEEMMQSFARSGERLLVSPTPAMYNGSTARYGKIKGNGVMALTEKRLLFRKLIGKDIEIDLADIQSVSENKWFMGEFRDFRNHLILVLKDGTKVGFMVKNHDEWMSKLRDRLP